MPEFSGKSAWRMRLRKDRRAGQPAQLMSCQAAQVEPGLQQGEGEPLTSKCCAASRVLGLRLQLFPPCSTPKFVKHKHSWERHPWDAFFHTYVHACA
eukprot:1146070-Pelagomonas_calceolata.AAC.3